MTQVYPDPSREADTYSLPNVEVFFMSDWDIGLADPSSCWFSDEAIPLNEGWYYWSCFPGCLPDSAPFGPYKTEQFAIEAAQDID